LGRACKSDAQSLFVVLVDRRKQRSGTIGRIGKPEAIYIVPAADDLQRIFWVRARWQLKRKHGSLRRDLFRISRANCALEPLQPVDENREQVAFLSIERGGLAPDFATDLPGLCVTGS